MMGSMRGRARVLLCIFTALAVSACSSTRDRAGEAGSFAASETRVAVNDAVGLPRQRPGEVMVDEGDDTVPTPYGGEGSRRRCSTVARDIARLTVVLGPDIEEQQRIEDAENPEREGWWEHSTHAVSQAPGYAADGARSLYRSTIVGLNPVRPVVRFIGRAGRIEREAQEQRDHAQRRRAYLRGLYDGFGCPESYMERAFEAYGLIEDVDGSH